MRTPAKILIAHRNRALIDALRREAIVEGLNLETLSLYSMFCTMKDYVEPEREKGGTCKYLVLGDLSLRLCPGPESTDQIARLGPLERFFADNGLPRLMLSQSGDAHHQEELLKTVGLEKEMNIVVDFFQNLWPTLTAAQQCVVTNCVHGHGVFILGILLAQSYCTADEYAEGLLAVDCVIPGVFDVSRREAAAAKKNAVSDAKCMLRFRALADAGG